MDEESSMWGNHTFHTGVISHCSFQFSKVQVKQLNSYILYLLAITNQLFKFQIAAKKNKIRLAVDDHSVTGIDLFPTSYDETASIYNGLKLGQSYTLGVMR